MRQKHKRFLRRTIRSKQWHVTPHRKILPISCGKIWCNLCLICSIVTYNKIGKIRIFGSGIYPLPLLLLIFYFPNFFEQKISENFRKWDIFCGLFFTHCGILIICFSHTGKSGQTSNPLRDLRGTLIPNANTPQANSIPFYWSIKIYRKWLRGRNEVVTSIYLNCRVYILTILKRFVWQLRTPNRHVTETVLEISIITISRLYITFSASSLYIWGANILS